MSKHSKRSKKPFLLRFFISMIATLLIFGTGLLAIYHYVFSGMEQDVALEKEEIGIEKKEEYFSNKVRNIALFGIDTLDKKMVGRSDSIIILTLDDERKEIRLSAIQRDSYVEMEHPKRGTIDDKINHAHAYGGPKLAVKTLNKNFGLDIQDYVVINFTNMEKVVDILGGIELEVSSAYRSEANHHITALAAAREIRPKLIKSTGKQNLTGMQVLGMLRCRKKVGGVGQRSSMHEILLNACFEKVKKKSVLEYPNIAKSLLKLVKTTLSSSEVTELGIKVLTGGYTIKQEVFPLAQDLEGYGGRMYGGVYYLTFNKETMPVHLRDFVYKSELPEKQELPEQEEEQ